MTDNWALSASYVNTSMEKRVRCPKPMFKYFTGLDIADDYEIGWIEQIHPIRIIFLRTGIYPVTRRIYRSTLEANSQKIKLYDLLVQSAQPNTEITELFLEILWKTTK